MSDTHYSCAPDLADIRGFAARAVADLRAAPRIGWQLFRAGLRSEQRRSLFGWLWLLLPAAVPALISLYLQSRRIISVEATQLPYALHVLAGMAVWLTFVDAINAPLRSLAAGRQILSRSRVPHEALVVAGLLEVGLNALVRAAALALVLLFYGLVPPVAALLLFPMGLGAIALLGLALSLLAAPWALLWEDVPRAVTLGTGLWFFLTPILYPVPARGLLLLNPATPAIETARGALSGAPLHHALLPALFGAALLLVAAWTIYRVARPHVVERLG